MKLILNSSDFGRLCFGERVLVLAGRSTSQYKALKKAFETGKALNVEVGKAGSLGGSIAHFSCYVDRPVSDIIPNNIGNREAFTIQAVDCELN